MSASDLQAMFEGGVLSCAALKAKLRASANVPAMLADAGRAGGSGNAYFALIDLLDTSPGDDITYRRLVEFLTGGRWRVRWWRDVPERATARRT